MGFEDYLFLAGLLALAALRFCLKLMACVGLAYGLLWGGNYLAEAWEAFPISAYEIEALHVLLGSLFMAILLSSGPDLQEPVENLDRSITYVVGRVEDKTQDIVLKLDSLDEIQSRLDFISEDVRDIRRKLKFQTGGGA